MRLQYLPWLFDDKDAWEKSFADPRYSYELPMDYFMSIYQVERKAQPPDSANEYAMPMPAAMPAYSMPAMPPPTAYAPVQVQSFAAAVPAMAAAPEPQKEAEKEEGILSQDEIDALLSGL